MEFVDRAKQWTRSQSSLTEFRNHQQPKLVPDVLDRLHQPRFVPITPIPFTISDLRDLVWSKYTSTPLQVNTQASYDTVSGQVNSSGILDFGNGSTFAKPTSADIFSNSTGPFATGSNAQTNAIIPRLAAAFNRSVLLLSAQTPNGTSASQYYTNAVTNVSFFALLW